MHCKGTIKKSQKGLGQTFKKLVFIRTIQSQNEKSKCNQSQNKFKLLTTLQLNEIVFSIHETL